MGKTFFCGSDAGSRVLSIALQNAVTKTLTYDAAWRATFVEYKTATTSIKKFEYAWNVADKRVLEKRHHSGGAGDNYDLDSLYRSIQVKAGVADPVAELATPGSQTVASTTGLTMDTANNRTQRVVTTGAGQTTTNYAADTLEFYTSVGGTAQTRDVNGNLRDDGTTRYAYDYRNRLVTVTRKSDSVVIAGYEYDSLSRRVGVTTSTGTARHCWIGAQLAMEYGGNGGVVSRRHYGADAGEVLTAQQLDVADLDGDGSTVDFVSITPLYDGAFDCVGCLDQTGALAESYVHSFDGSVTITNGAGQAIAASAIGWQQGYGRGYRDTQTGFVYNLHRYYSPTTGRFVTTDPVGTWFDRGALGNGYAWVGGGYRNGWDPLGLAPGYPRTNGATYTERTTLASAMSTLHGGLRAAKDAGTSTPPMDAMLEALDANAEIWIQVEDQEEDPENPQKPDMWESARGATVKSGRFRIHVLRDALGKSNEWMWFTMLHELLHFSKRRCGNEKEHHGNDRRSVRKYNKEVSAIFKILMKQKLAFGRFVDEKALARAKAYHGLRSSE